jgi:hypothetical protein
MGKDVPKTWRHVGGDGHGYRYIDNMTEAEITEREALQAPYNAMLDRQSAYEDARVSQHHPVKPSPVGCVFAKSCNLPDGITNHNNQNGFIPVEPLKDYGDWAVLSTSTPLTATASPLMLVGGSSSGTALAGRLGGALSLGLTEAALTAGVVAGSVVGIISMLIPNTSIAPDSAFYTKEQYAMLALGSTRVRVHVAQLPDKSVTTYGFYTGKHPDWQKIPVIAATARGDSFVADIGQGIELIWTPAVDTSEILGIPALEGAPKLPAVWVYPPTEQANKILVNPVHPPDYQDAIIWFPAKPEIAPIYISLNVRGLPGVVTGTGEDVTGIWLAGAGNGLGSPVPTQIADKLRGREFSSFDAFRKAFWIEVGNDSSLSSQFNQDNIKRLGKGLAPTTRVRDQIGKRISFELHHVERIADGGAVYDVDNLRANTPKNHIDMHRETQ